MQTGQNLTLSLLESEEEPIIHQVEGVMWSHGVKADCASIQMQLTHIEPSFLQHQRNLLEIEVRKFEGFRRHGFTKEI